MVLTLTALRDSTKTVIVSTGRIKRTRLIFCAKADFVARADFDDVIQQLRLQLALVDDRAAQLDLMPAVAVVACQDQERLVLRRLHRFLPPVESALQTEARGVGQSLGVQDAVRHRDNHDGNSGYSFNLSDGTLYGSYILTSSGLPPTARSGQALRATSKSISARISM